jgi:uncharacterized membrane protein YkvA (DUF1232 family)
MIDTLKRWARRLKRDVIALYLAARDPRTPWYAKAMAALVAAYALSPIDLIPDFIPVLGYVDDLILVPVGIMLATRMIPDDVMAACRDKATTIAERPRSTAGLVIIAAIWILSAVALWMLWR